MQLERSALGAAVVLSVVSVGDAVVRATTDVVPPWDDESPPPGRSSPPTC